MCGITVRDQARRLADMRTRQSGPIDEAARSIERNKLRDYWRSMSAGIPAVSTQKRHGLMASQKVIAIIATTTAAHTTGVARFELPLRGESLTAWLNS
jgi:hypothetical protein